jgi:hypothetical protein
MTMAAFCQHQLIWPILVERESGAAGISIDFLKIGFIQPSGSRRIRRSIFLAGFSTLRPAAFLLPETLAFSRSKKK